MTDRTYRISLIVVAGLLYLGVFGYSVFSYTGTPFQDQAQGTQTRDTESETRTSRTRTRAPMIMYYGSGVRVYERRSVRSVGQRGGGIRGGK